MLSSTTNYLLFQRYSQCQAGHKVTVSMRVGGNFNFLPRSTVGKHISWADLWPFPVNDPNGVWGLWLGGGGGGGDQILFPRPICQQSSGVLCLTAFSCDALICYECVLLLCFWLRVLCTGACSAYRLCSVTQCTETLSHFVTLIFVSLTEMHCTKGPCPACDTDLRITQKCTVPKDPVPLVTQIFVSFRSALCQRALSRL